MHCAKFGWNWPSGSWEKDFKIPSIYFHYFIIASPWKGVALHLNKLESPSSKDSLCQVCINLAWWFRRKGSYKILNKYICYFIIIFPWKKVWPFIWTNLNPLHPTMYCAKFDWNWPSCSGEGIFKFANVLLLFRYYLPLEKGWALHLHNLSPHHPSMLCAKSDSSGSWEEDFKISLRMIATRMIPSPASSSLYVILTSPWNIADMA